MSGRHDKTPWTNKENARLRQLCARGISYGDIAMVMRRSRNSVIGYADRKGIDNGRHNTGARPAKPPRPNYSPRRRITPVAPRPEPPEVVQITSEAFDQAIPESQRRTLLELTAETCRWPVGRPGTPEFFFCGAIPLNGNPYCREHDARAFIPPTGRLPYGFR